MPILVRFLLLLSFIYFSVSAKETNNVITIEDGKVHYILQTFKHLTGLRENRDDHYVLGIYGKAQDLISSFHKKVSTSTLSKKIIIETIDEQTPPERLTAIFVTKKHIDSIEVINKRFPQSLIITDGQVDREQQMVSLVVNKGQVTLKINRENLLIRGFKVSNSLLDFAGNREDLSSKLLDQENYLRTLFLNSQEQEKKLVKLNHQHHLSNNKLNKIKLELNDKIIQLQKNEGLLLQEHSQLKVLQQQKKNDQELINSNKISISKQKQLITTKQQYLEKQKDELLNLNENVISNQILLKQQLEEITKKNDVITAKEKTITSQKLLLYIIGTFTLVAIILIYFVFYLYKTRKRANKNLIALNDQLYELAITDGMTQLFNRRHFIESAQVQEKQLKRNKSSYIVLMIDIDHFKNVNDSYGHAMGDAAIIYIADILKENLREYDIAGRIGGEEFVMMLPECKLDVAIKIAERLRKRIADSEIIFQNNTINLTISIGLTSLNIKDKDFDQVLQRADDALYQAKESGRNKVVVL
ncbi:YfiR/HmsC family protein [Colwellia psychrerythraea]|uniref:diguanylate cyclase n=1 Tax=Colwellia psychrerythraea TaxID=28229 RepID=A0A099KRM4_COLPS|nr:YfiR/HmsC family protein [Colwellia psychrerythraea]KGJ92875.1 diguanylate cyclase [Colwellia psychrerythraea]